MRIVRAGLALALSAMIAASGCTAVAAEDAADAAEPGVPPLDTAAVQQALEEAVDEDVIGALVRVDSPDGTWTATAGSAIAGRRRPVDPDGRFRMGSITKTFVATVVLQLVDQGKVALDEPVQTYLPDALPGGYPPVTVRQLLHTPAASTTTART